METLRLAILECIENNLSKITIAELEKFVCHRLGSRKNDVRKALRHLAEAGIVA